MITNYETLLESEETLDPQDWEQLRQIGHRMVDEMLDFLRDIRQHPVWQQPPAAAKASFKKPLPEGPESLETIYQDFRENILPYPKGNIHPRFWSWVQGSGSPQSMLAEMLASGMNSNVAIGEHSAMYVDSQVIEWCKSMLGYPAEASGLLVGGGSVANITALIVARNAFGDRRIRQHGLRALPGQMVLYASSETHSCIQKAVEILGLGSDALRKIRIGADYRMDTAHLRQRIAEDRAAGFLPFCVVANAGTVNTGAIDPLDEILDICREENLWLHIDGAFGALAKLVPEYQAVLRPLEEADSVAFDLHKWMYLPYEIGCVLVKNADLHRSAFALQPEYLLSHERGLAAGPDPIGNYSMELSRGFKALKVWMSFREHGIEKFARLIRQNIAQSFYLEKLVLQEPELELLTPVTMNIVCFRYRKPGLDTAELNILNQEILMRLHEENVATPSYTLLDGKYAIRVANVNHRSRKEDFEALVAGVLRIGRTFA